MRPSALGLGVSRDKNRRGKQYRARVFHHRGLLDLGRFETEDEAKLAYDQAVRALKLEKSLNYPSTSQQYFSPDVDRKVQAFVAKNAEPSNSANSTPRAPDAQHGSPTLSGNSTASGEPRDSMQGLPQPVDDFMQLPSDEFQADVHPSLEQTAAAAMPGHLDCTPMMQLAAQAMGFHEGSAGDMLAASHMCTPWDQVALQMGLPASYEQVSCEQLGSGVPYAGAQAVEEQQANDGLQQPAIKDQHEQVLAPQPQPPQQLPVDASSDDVRVMLALLAEILAEDEVQDLEALGAVAASQPQLQEQPFLQQHGCSAGYAAAPASSYLQAAPAGSPSTPVTQGSPTYSMGQQAAASSAAHQQQHYALAAGALSSDPPQQQAMLPSLSSCGEVVLFVDVTTKLMLQLYTQLTANTMQHAGLTAIQWMSDVRMSLSAPGFSTPGSSPSLSGDCSFGAAGLPFSVQCAVLHTCSSLVAVGAGGSADMSVGMAGSCPFSSCFLVAVLEQVMKVLMSLRSLCAASCPNQGLSSAVLQVWQSQLQALASTQVGQAVAALLGWVVVSAYA